jgi:hypothetical protein
VAVPVPPVVVVVSPEVPVTVLVAVVPVAPPVPIAVAVAVVPIVDVAVPPPVVVVAGVPSVVLAAGMPSVIVELLVWFVFTPPEPGLTPAFSSEQPRKVAMMMQLTRKKCGSRHLMSAKAYVVRS